MHPQSFLLDVVRLERIVGEIDEAVVGRAVNRHVGDDSRVSGERLLVNYWYAYPVGHAIEGLRYALGYKAAGPEPPREHAPQRRHVRGAGGSCPFVDEVYAVPYTSFQEPDADPHEALADVPREWDWVVDNHRGADQSHDRFRGFRAFIDAAGEHSSRGGDTGSAARSRAISRTRRSASIFPSPPEPPPATFERADAPSRSLLRVIPAAGGSTLGRALGSHPVRAHPALSDRPSA